MPSDVSCGLNIDLDSLTPDARVSFPVCLTLLERAATRTGCLHFGLTLGTRYGWSSHGLIYRIASHAPTLRQALIDFVTWQLGYSSGAVVYLHRMGSACIFGYGAYDRVSIGSRQLYELSAAVGCSAIRELSDGQTTPVEVLMPHKPPDDLRPYREALKVPVRFNQNQCGLVLPASEIDRPVPGADPVKREEALRAAAAQFASLFQSTAARLRHVMRPQLVKEDPSMDGAARALRLTPRTLRRRLTAEGETFEAIREEVRFKTARELLDLTDLPISEISLVLAFASQASFAQAFRRWSGMSAMDWRKRGNGFGSATVPIVAGGSTSA